MASIVYLLIFLMLGYISKNIISTSKTEILSKAINRFIIYVSLPSLVLVYMIDMDFNRDFILPIVSAWGIIIVSIIMILVLSKVFEWSKSITGALFMIIPFGNTSFLGIPFTKLFFGDEGVSFAVIYDQLGSFLMLSTVGIIILSIYSGHRVSAPIILYKLVTFPSTMALVLAFIISTDMVPVVIMNLLGLLASTLTPLALVTIGLHLKILPQKSNISPMAIGLLIKLIVGPILLFMIFKALGITGLVAKVSILESGMGPMMSSGMLAIGAGLEKRFVASTLSYGIIISLVTLPLIHWLSVSFL